MRRIRTVLVRAGLLAGMAALAAGLSWPAQASTPGAPAPSADGAPAGPEVIGVRRGAQVPHNGPADIARFRAAHAGLIPGGRPDAGTDRRQIHPAQGTALLATNGVNGAGATQSVAPDLTVTSSASTVYVPTLYPPGGSCVEVSTRYVPGAREVAAWDWCNTIGFAASVPIDKAFIGRYTHGDSAYRVRVVRTDTAKNTWQALLFDYQTNTWDTLFTSSGVTQGGNPGWDIYELYSDVDGTGQSSVCADLNGKNFEAAHIAVRTGTDTWTPANHDNADTHFDQPASAFACSSMTYSMVEELDHWKATG